MPSEKALRGVAHDLAQHAQSGLGWLYPHLLQACRDAGVRETTFELLAPQPYPQGLPDREPLRLALVALREWFIDLLARLDYDVASIESAVLSFQFRPNSDGSDPAVRASVTTSRGKRYSAAFGRWL